MNLKRLLVSGIAAGVVVNAYDFLVHGNLLAARYAAAPFRQGVPIYLMVIGDFVAAFVLAWVWMKVKSSFGSGWKAGLTGGLYAGILVNFPAAIFQYLMIDGISYELAWIWTAVGVVWYLLAGAVIGAVDRG